MDKRTGLDGQAIGIMLVLCAIWGLQQAVLKATATDIAPLMQIALRSGISALLVSAFMFWRKEPMSISDGTLGPGVIAGLLFALEFFFVGEALRLTSASHTVVLVYTAPIFVALGLHWKLPAERLGLVQWGGIALAFSGIVVTFLGRGAHTTDVALNDMLWGDALALFGGMAWGATTVAIRLTRLSNAPAAQTLLYQLVLGFVLLLILAVLLGQTAINPTPAALAGLAFQGVIVSFASFLIWFWLLRRYLASQLGVFSFLTPLFGIAFGVLLLDEPLEPNFIVGAVLVLAGVSLVSGHRMFSRRSP